MKNVFVLTQEQCRLQSTYNPSPSAQLLLGKEMLDPNYGKQDPTSMSPSYGKVTLLQVGSPPSSLNPTQKIRCIIRICRSTLTALRPNGLREGKDPESPIPLN